MEDKSGKAGPARRQFLPFVFITFFMFQCTSVPVFQCSSAAPFDAQFIFEIYFPDSAAEVVIKAAKLKDGKMTQGTSLFRVLHVLYHILHLVASPSSPRCRDY